MEFLNELIYILNAMSPYLLLGFLIAGLLHAFIPQKIFSRYLSKPGFRSVALSALVGVPLPLCSCGVIPTAMSLKKAGATDGATVSFLIATPQTGIDSILASYGVLGLPFAIIRPIVAFVVALMGGALVNRFSKGDKTVIASEESSSSIKSSKSSKLLYALKYGFVEMMQDLGRWLTVGLIIAAAITAFVPSSIFVVLADHYLLNILVVLLLSIPMYICSTGSIPIALSLMMKGISPGAALIFLMAGPATNVATLAVVRKVLGRRTTLLYLLSITLGAIGFAVLIDFALPTEWFSSTLSYVASSDHCNDGTAWWQIASSILFILLLINAYILKITGHGHSHSHNAATKSFKVSGIRCNHCKANIEKAITALPNVESVTIDISSGIVEVQGGVSQEEVCSAVKQLGFEIEKK